MADRGSTDGERTLWREKAHDLAQKYDLFEIIERWDISAEGSSSRTSTVRVGASSIYIHQDDQEWANLFTATLASAFDLIAIKRTLREDDHEYVDGQHDQFFAYDFVGLRERTHVAIEVCTAAVDIGYDLLDGFIIESSQLPGFMMEFAEQIVMRVRAKRASAGALVLVEEETEKFLSDNYGRHIGSTIVPLSRAVAMTTTNTDQVRVEAYLAAKKVGV